MEPERQLLAAHLTAARQHVRATCEGLSEEDLVRTVVPSGWSMASMLNHLTFDDEIFWGCAILGGDEEAVALVQDGWAVPVSSGAESLERYAVWAARTDEILRTADLDAPPRWWPGEDVFPFPAFPHAHLVVGRLLVETSTHAGHMDVARELVDGHQHLVLG